MTKKRQPKKSAYHEAGHAVATYFRPEAGVTRVMTIRPEDLDEDAGGLHSRGSVIRPIVGAAVDWVQVNAYCLMLFAGAEAEMRFTGRELSGGSSDWEKAFDMLKAASSDDARSLAREILRSGTRPKTLSKDEIRENYVNPATARLHARFEELRAEAKALIEEKWHCVEALANALYKAKRLDGDALREIIKKAEERHQAEES